MQKKKQKVLVAMSGGADSSAAAFLLQQEGYDVSGIYMRLGSDYTTSEAAARRSCERLGIKLYPVNIAEQFEREIIDYFISAYEQGDTPNPCVRCNRQIKFGSLLSWREKLGADFLATGHYIRKEWNEVSEEYELYRPLDARKDQSYFLYNLGQKELPYLLFPLAKWKKDDLKELLKKENIPFLSKESMDICFLMKDGRPQAQGDFLTQKIKLKPGNIILLHGEGVAKKRKGELIGQHKGLPLYTIGQRRGVDIGGRGPYYVAGMSYPQNCLYVVQDQNDELLMSKQVLSKANHFINRENMTVARQCQAMIRYGHRAEGAELFFENYDKTEIAFKIKENSVLWLTRFQSPLRALAKGQSLVWYDGDRLLGGGLIVAGDIFDITDFVV
jgi:tRNA-specific 2-thiouridylase